MYSAPSESAHLAEDTTTTPSDGAHLAETPQVVGDPNCDSKTWKDILGDDCILRKKEEGQPAATQGRRPAATQKGADCSHCGDTHPTLLELRNGIALLKESIQNEKDGIYEDCSQRLVCGDFFICRDEGHRKNDKFTMRVCGEYHKRCDDCGKCVLSTKPEIDDGALQLAIKILKGWEADVEALGAEVATARWTPRGSHIEYAGPAPLPFPPHRGEPEADLPPGVAGGGGASSSSDTAPPAVPGFSPLFQNISERAVERQLSRQCR